MQGTDPVPEDADRLAGFRLLEHLGDGPTWALYRGLQLSLDRAVAIKVLHPDLADDPYYVKRFVADARIAARMRHPHLVQGIDLPDSEDAYFLVLELVEGMSVGSLLATAGVMAEDRALRIAHQVARALEHAHANGLVHRAVNPWNIIITKHGAAKLCDYGVALHAHANARAGAAFDPDLDTVPYASPEQTRVDFEVDQRTDIYSLGATLFHMATGRPAFQGKTREILQDKHLNAPVPSPRGLAPHLSEATEAIIKRCLAKKRSRRFQKAAELTAALAAAAAASTRAVRIARPLPPPPRPDAPAAPVRRRARRRRP